jgi:hypothetical protein
VAAYGKANSSWKDGMRVGVILLPDESVLQRAIRQAARDTGLRRQVTPHSLRHASPRICSNRATTFGPFRSCSVTKTSRLHKVYTHVLNRGGRGVQSPADLLGSPQPADTGISGGTARSLSRPASSEARKDTLPDRNHRSTRDTESYGDTKADAAGHDREHSEAE